MVQEGKRKNLPLLVALMRGARNGTLMRELSSYAPEWSARRWGIRFKLAYELLRELRSVYFRIAEMHRIGADERGWSMTGLLAVPENLQDLMIQAHNEGIRNLLIQRPWLPASGVALYLEGIEAGAKLILRNADRGKNTKSRSSM